MSLEFRCRDVGVVCKAKVTGETPEQLLTKIAEHADNAHGVPELSETLVDYALTLVKEK
jgi:predicted small metal-binding protein